MIYPRVSKQFIKNTVSKDLYEALYPALFNLSAILTDTDGKLNNTDVISLNSLLEITNPGILVLGGNILKVTETHSDFLPDDEFIPDVSFAAYQLSQRLKTVDPVLVSLNTVRSKLLDFDTYNITTLEYRIAIASIYLECYTAYRVLLEAQFSEGIWDITLQDLERIKVNLRCITRNFEQFDEKPYEYIEMLRDLYKTIAYISSLNLLFNSEYVRKINDFKEKTRSVRK